MVDVPQRRRWTRVLRPVVCAGLVLVLGSVALGFFLQHRLDSHVRRIDGVFAGLEDRPPRASGTAGRALDVLVLTIGTSGRPVTSDSVEAPTWLRSARHVDAVQLLHVNGDRRTGACVAIPLATPVDVPGGRRTTLGRVVQGARPARTIAAVEQLTNTRIDHLAAFDWDGFARLTDLKGGMLLRVRDVVLDGQGEQPWPVGEYTVSGPRTLSYLTTTGRLPDPALGESLRLQYLYRQLMDDTLHQELRKQPLHLYRTLDVVSRHLWLDEGWSSGQLRNTVIGLRNLRSSDIDYLTVPVTADAGAGGASASAGLRLDEQQNAALWRALRADRVEEWLEDHPERRVPPVVP